MAEFRRYLSLLGVAEGAPTLAHLRLLVRAQLERVPFENVSKLFWLKTRGLRGVPELGAYLDGIERHHFGGTCYSNNPHFAELLRHLGYEVTLCGADMSTPDLHTALLVRAEGREVLVDVGYGAPFFEPAPRDATAPHTSALGNERWLVEPPDAEGRSRVRQFRDGVEIHGYRVKPTPRDLAHFRGIIGGSFTPDAHFMTSVRLVRFEGNRSVAVSNLDLIETEGDAVRVTKLPGPDALVDTIHQRFGIPADVTRVAIADVAAVHPG